MSEKTEYMKVRARAFETAMDARIAGLSDAQLASYFAVLSDPTITTNWPALARIEAELKVRRQAVLLLAGRDDPSLI